MVSAKRPYQVAFALSTALFCATVASAAEQQSFLRSKATPADVTVNAPPALRGRRQEETFECRLSLFSHLQSDRSVATKDCYMCSPLINGRVSGEEYEIEIDDKVKSVYAERSKDELEVVLAINGATINETAATITYESASALSVLEPTARNIRRQMLENEGQYKVLAIRIILNDAQPYFTKENLYKLLFQDRISLRNQYKACSWGKVLIEPSSRGVIEVRVGLSSTTSSHQQVVNAATRAALDYLQSQGVGTFTGLREYADMVLYITPSMGDWLAYASVGGGTSVYNDKWGGYVASVMHETGHNFQLTHAYEGGVEYEDYTGYMGGAIISYHDQTGFPSMCYNAANHWQLGWYAERSIELDMYTPALVRVAAFADYDKTTAGRDYVVVKSSNVYMHYNRAKGINGNTTEYRDYLTLYQADTDATYLFAALSYPDKPVYERTFSQGTWHVEICEQVFGDNYYTPDYLLVSVGFGSSQCNTVSPMGEEDADDDDDDDDNNLASVVYHVTVPVEKNVKKDRNRGNNRRDDKRQSQ